MFLRIVAGRQGIRSVVMGFDELNIWKALAHMVLTNELRHEVVEV
jgi:hypothetical protein